MAAGAGIDAHPFLKGNRLIVANSVVTIAKPPSASTVWTRPGDQTRRAGPGRSTPNLIRD